MTLKKWARRLADQIWLQVMLKRHKEEDEKIRKQESDKLKGPPTIVLI